MCWKIEHKKRRFRSTRLHGKFQILDIPIKEGDTTTDYYEHHYYTTREHRSLEVFKNCYDEKLLDEELAIQHGYVSCPADQRVGVIWKSMMDVIPN
jgi:hypothetical protein